MISWPWEFVDAPLEEGVLTTSPSNVAEVGTGAPSEVITTPLPPSKSTGTRPSRKRMIDWVVVSTYVSPLERVTPSMDIVALVIEDVVKLIHH